MRLLLTRPSDDAERLAALLEQRGHEPVVAPLMEFRAHTGETLALDGVQAVLATSANGIRALTTRTSRRDIPIFAVGPQTEEAARKAGFAVVHNADGDASALVELVVRSANPEQGALFHAAGADTAGRVRRRLEAAGFRVTSPVLYETVAPTTLPLSARNALSQGRLDGVLLFSPRSAKIFAGLVADAGLAPACQALDAYCISAATAEGLGGLRFQRVIVAEAPNQEAILALLP